MQAEGKQEREIAAETARLRQAYLTPILAAYESHFNRLVGLNQDYQAKVRAAEEGRIAFNQGVEDRIFQARIAGLSSFDQYVAKAKEADRLVSLSREAAERGDTKLAESYGNKAIAIADTMGAAYSKNGAKIVSETEAAAKKTGVLADVQQAVNTAYRNAGAAAKEGADETQRQLDRVTPILTQLRDLATEVNNAMAQGMTLAVEVDQTSIANAQAVLEELTRPRTVTITVQTVQGSASGGFIGKAWGLARSGAVQAAQAFAGGGSVFRRQPWSKVPGSGSGDTVPASLREGSFVVRKAASQYYGDGLMQRVARGFAVGGNVFRPGASASRVLSGRGLSTGVDLQGLDPAVTAELHSLKVTAEQEFYKILSRASGLPVSRWGQNVSEYVSRVLEIIRSSMDVDEIKALMDRILVFYNRFYPAIEVSHQFHVPLVMGANVVGDPNPVTNTPSSGNKPPPGWSPFMQQGSPFADGGSARDTVPAWLTPGEWVVRPERVANFGPDFMYALNNMAVPRDVLAGLLAPTSAPRGYATGGPVGGAATAASSGPRAWDAANGGGNTYNFNLDATDLLSEEHVRRKVVPVLDSMNRRSR